MSKTKLRRDVYLEFLQVYNLAKHPNLVEYLYLIRQKKEATQDKDGGDVEQLHIVMNLIVG